MIRPVGGEAVAVSLGRIDLEGPASLTGSVYAPGVSTLGARVSFVRTESLEVDGIEVGADQDVEARLR